MKNKKHIILFALLFINFYVFSQEIKIDKEIIYVDNKIYLKVDKKRNSDAGYSIYNLQGKEIIFIKTMADPNDYRFTYEKISFLGLNKYIESKENLKFLIKQLYNSNAVNENGELELNKVDILVEKYGNSVTGNSKVIILKN